MFLVIDIGQALNEVQFLPVTAGVVVACVLAFLLLFASGYASGSEIAFFSLTPQDLSVLEKGEASADKSILTLRDDSERTLATILITNNLVNVTIIMLCNYIFDELVDFGGAYWLQFICITVILTFILLLFGEIMPKVYCSHHSLQFCRFSVPGILFLRKLFYPFSSVLIRSGVLAEKVVQKDNHTLSRDDLEQALELTDNEDIKEEKQLLEGIVHFGEETAESVMTGRQDVVDIDIKSSFRDVLGVIVENNYSRMPVYEGSIDNVRGILYIKDLLPHLGKPDNFHWQSLIRPPYFVPETKKIDDLLRDFQKNKVHIAVVVDEFGGTSGIVTMEDVLEEIVGDINDEYDEDEKSYIKINNNTFIFEGKTELADFFRILSMDEDMFADIEEEADTIAGLLLYIKGEFPKLHEKLDFKNLTFEALEMDEHRISKVKVIVHEPKA